MPLEYLEEYNRRILPSTIDSLETKRIVKQKGVWIWDEDGKKYFDGASQVSMANIGHNHPKLLRWTIELLEKAHKGDAVTTLIATDAHYANSHEFDGEVMDLTPVGLEKRLEPHIFGIDKTIFGPDVCGSQAVNDAIRYFRTITGKTAWISFDRAFHGRHGESRDSSKSNPVHWNEAPRNRNTYFLPYPETREDLNKCIEQLNFVPLKKTACMIYEPIQGEGGGMSVGHYLKDLEQVLKPEGIFSVSDEIQSGMGRSGEWFAYQKMGLNPDAVVLGKSLGTIVPVSGYAVKKEINDAYKFPKGKNSGTYPGYPLGMATSNFVLRIYEEENLVENVRNLSPKFEKMLYEAINLYDLESLYGINLAHIKVDGMGFYRSIKFFDENGKPDAKKRDEVHSNIRNLGVWTYKASKDLPAIRLTPPLNCTEQHLKYVTQIIRAALMTTKSP